MNIEDSIENGGNASQVPEQAASQRRRIPSLSDTALVLLSAAANRIDGSVLPPPGDLKARGGALKAVLSHLLARDLVEEIAVSSDTESWRRDNDAGRVGLRITVAGCAAIGVEALGVEPAVLEADRLVGEGAARDLSAATDGSGIAGNVRRGDEADTTDDPLDGTITWTDEGMDPVASASDANVDRVPVRFTAPRSPSKQDKIIALLSRQEGAAIDELMTLTGWLPHTVRAVLSGLRKKGHRIDRQKDGDTGSVYRIVPPPILGAERAASDGTG